MANFSEMTNAVNSGTAEMFTMAWQATADPDMYQIYHSEGGSNEKSYWVKDAQLDELIMMARQSTDKTYRKTLYKECLDIVADWAVEIPVYQRQNVIIFSTERVNIDTVTPDITTFWGWMNDIEKLELN
jgi:peptide/nickel transport system substrate-binding protein